MKVTVSDVMRHVRNHFAAGYEDGTWQITDNRLSPDRFSPGEWIAIPGLGVCRLDEYGALPIEEHAPWKGRIWHLTPPAGFLHLCARIEEWSAHHPDPALTEERFGSYSCASSSGSWQTVFANDLRPYLRMYQEVDI